MSDISAVVLSLGEETVPRAVRSVEKQTLPVRDIVQVENVTPFHRALNQGASQVRSTYFCQVDADMVLDPDCFERLLAVADATMGIVAGYLRDPLMGKVSCVKIFRRECFDAVQFEDSISPDTDFQAAIRVRGWTAAFALRYHGPKKVWHTFGSHEPDYSPPYTFRKYLLEGRRYLYRGKLHALVWHLDALKKSEHPVALVAEIAMAHGVFRDDDRDRLGRLERDPEFVELQDFLSQDGPIDPDPLPGLDAAPPCIFRSFYERGFRLRSQGAGAAFHAWVRALHESPARFAWLGRVALFHGIFAKEVIPEVITRDFAVIEALLQTPR